ncbi:YiiX/YebB-like N1pC/P60 family cysteine hydrolase [Sporosalibacterium faouarense]|uniref:YiiX/YebB-like N1pC/P60 family cysteine hydrolase n=1 Tax=Sporosalibacterium faouarense TaxID=516123 RepID=UPI00192C4DE0|nr:YiiX/YebB-like N1pC/P60 family cysteine hydrolase [Sporosalibacterium faouarense]
MKKFYSKFLSITIILIMLLSVNSMGFAESPDINLKAAYKEITYYADTNDIPLNMTFEDFIKDYKEQDYSNAQEYLDVFYSLLQPQSEIESSSSSSGGGSSYYYNIGTSLPSDVHPDYSKYNLKDVIKKGDVIYEDNGGFGITGHIAIVEGFHYNSEQDVTYIRLIEAISDGVVRSLLDDTRVDDKDVTILRVDDATSTNITDAISFCSGEVGSSYSLDFAKDTSSSETDWYCSELVWASYKNQDIDIEKSGFSEPGITPHDIMNSSEVSEIDFSEQ